jgi:hypothetical protein
MSRGAPSIPAEIDLDTPLRLDVAARLAFPGGGMSASGLRKERDRKRLVIEKIAGKEFTTLRFIEQMRFLCREVPKEQGSGSSPKNETQTESSPGARHGLSGTDRTKSALAALEQTAKALSKPSPITSPKNTRPRETATVIHLKS